MSDSFLTLLWGGRTDIWMLLPPQYWSGYVKIKKKEMVRLTILLDSLLAVVFAAPSDLSTAKEAERCLKVSVSAPPPPADSNSCRRSTMDVCVLPEPDAPDTMMAWK